MNRLTIELLIPIIIVSLLFALLICWCCASIKRNCLKIKRSYDIQHQSTGAGEEGHGTPQNQSTPVHVRYQYQRTNPGRSGHVGSQNQLSEAREPVNERNLYHHTEVREQANGRRHYQHSGAREPGHMGYQNQRREAGEPDHVSSQTSRHGRYGTVDNYRRDPNEQWSGTSHVPLINDTLQPPPSYDEACKMLRS